MLTREQLFELAERHRDELWNDRTAPLGRGDEVLARHGIDKLDATALVLTMAHAAQAKDRIEGQAAMVMQGLIFGLWLADQDDG